MISTYTGSLRSDKSKIESNKKLIPLVIVTNVSSSNNNIGNMFPCLIYTCIDQM